jgi:hypothetical protein
MAILTYKRANSITVNNVMILNITHSIFNLDNTEVFIYIRKRFKALADGKNVFIGTKTGSGIFAYISSITCAPCKTSADWIRVLVA